MNYSAKLGKQLVISKPSIETNGLCSAHCTGIQLGTWPDDIRQDSIKDDYLSLSTTIRSVASQVAILSHLERYSFATTAAFIRSLNYDFADDYQDKLPNFWYKLRAGRAVTQSNTLRCFFSTVDAPTAELLRHPLWFFLDTRKPIKRSVEQYKAHQFQMSEKWQFFNSLSCSELQHPSQEVRDSIFRRGSFDLLFILLFQTLKEFKDDNLSRPTLTESYVYALFLFLFGYKYRILKFTQLSRLIHIRLAPNAPATVRLPFEHKLRSETRRINQLAQLPTLSSEDDVDDLISTKILYRSLSKGHKCFS